ncbi:BatB [hydrothermal vent metagenome]|uniref:BatB n=1 Tax=hydrothermal vent metagenome TaxID=652676 RepID=A0A3B1DY08_9ZZZZ
MRFAQPAMFHFFWFWMALIVFLFWTIKNREAVCRRFAQAPLLKHLVKNFDAGKLAQKNILLILVFFFSILALSRPQWGFQWQEVKREAVDILVVIDTSRSMLTQDVKPNRLERTKLAVKDLLKKLKGDRIGLIAFAGEAFLVCPLTGDYSGFVLMLNDLSTETVPRGGTNISNALEVAMKGYEDTPSQYKAVIIVTDGDNLEGDPLVMAKKAKEKGIKVFTIGIGTREGELIQLQDNYGNKEFLKDNNGNFVKSRLNEELLQRIALLTDGVYVKASGAEFGLDLIYDQKLSKWKKREIESKMEKRYYERFGIPLAIAIILLVIETCLTTRKRKKLF